MTLEDFLADVAIMHGNSARVLLSQVIVETDDDVVLEVSSVRYEGGIVTIRCGPPEELEEQDEDEEDDDDGS